MLLICLLDWYRALGRARGGIGLVQTVLTESKIGRVLILRLLILLLAQTIQIAAMWAGALWVLSTDNVADSLSRPLGEVVASAITDPLVSPRAAAVAAIATGCVLALDAAWVVRDKVAVRLTSSAARALTFVLGLAALGGALLGSFGLLFYGFPPDAMTTSFLVYFFIGASGWLSGRLALAQLPKLFPPRADDEHGRTHSYQNL
jgi:hypothetical protein